MILQDTTKTMLVILYYPSKQAFNEAIEDFIDA